MLLADIYPAEACLPDGRVLRGVRVQITPAGYLVVWQDVTGVAKPVFAEPGGELLEVPALGTVWHQSRLKAATAAGLVVVNQTRPGGCNCGNSPLYSLTEMDASLVDQHFARSS